MSERRTAASFLFYPSIPRRFEVAELLRVSATLKAESGETPYKLAEREVLTLLESNREVSRDNVYGLTAVALQRKGILGKVQSRVATLRVKGEQPRHAPGKRVELIPVEVLSNNHRYFEGPDGERIDPLYKLYARTGKKIEVHRPYRIPPYPATVAAGVLAQFDDHRKSEKERKLDNKQQWFNNVTHRIARRQRMTPDVWTSSDKQAVRARRHFEGLLRLFVPRMKEEDSERWEHYLVNALCGEFPRMARESAVNFVMRLQQPEGPAAPPGLYRQRKKIKLVEPSIESGSSGR